VFIFPLTVSQTSDELSMEISATASLDLADLAVEESHALLFDTRAPFEQWLQMLGARHAASELTSFSSTDSHNSDRTHLESFSGSECEVVFKGVLIVDGPLKGNIRSSDGTLVMTEQGRIEADVAVRVALINGHLEGNIRAREHVVLDSNARVSGNIHTPSLSIRDGAVFEGHSFLLDKPASSGSSAICEAQPKAELLGAIWQVFKGIRQSATKRW
jgi:cytoskeletal protein CcmA (bactofilin family)